MNSNGYIPHPIDTSDIRLPEELEALAEALSRNVHEIWAQTRLEQGWTYGPQRDDRHKRHPSLVPYDELQEAEKVFDKNTAFGTLKLIEKLGFSIVRK